MSPMRMRRLSSAVLLMISSNIMPSSAAAPGRADAPFLAANEAAMTKMMNGMAIRSAGDADTDFVAMMVPHHHGAIEMAEAELRWGHNEQLRRIAQEIIVDQQQEIVAMRLALGQPLPPAKPAPTGSVAR
jgi:uncharacterized protein (DUF305 family)